ncbi:MAG TPA: hypothetical protein VNZ03_10165 [Terriglobales bacterium]|nr:hypothetical protein [Terriglobales bacterium]
MLSEQVDVWTPSSEEEKAAVIQQLERLLQNPHFHKSKRFPVFLRFVVGEALAGRADNLKERTLGIEVFGKDPNYDTTEDPIVRVTAGEIRKRIAQYYLEPGHEHEIRVLLPPGSYAPQFCFPEDAKAVNHKEQALAVEASMPNAVFTTAAHSFSWGTLVVTAAVLALTLGVGFAWRALHPPAIEQFWAPFVKSADPILFCIADQNQYSTITLRDAANPQRQTTLNDHMITVIIEDMNPVVDIAGLLHTYGKSYRVQGESVTTLSDLRRSPSIFIGAYDNGWTLRLTGPLRFHFVNNPEMTRFWIEDRNNPTKQDWVIERAHQDTGTYKDYAIVARLLDPNTDRFVVVAAGIARGGTVAAGEFLVDAHHLDELALKTSKDWSRKNLEVVLETQVIDGRSGPPRIDEVYTW